MDFVFKKKNYILLISGLVLILTGIFLMIGGESEDPTKFSEEIFGGDFFLPVMCVYKYQYNNKALA